MCKMLSIIFIGLLLMLGTVKAATSDLPQKIEVKENQNAGTLVATVEVTANDSAKLTLKGDILNYLRVVDNLSCTNTASCKKFDLVTIKEIDREKVPNGFVVFTPEFTDGSVGKNCILIILDENDNVPVFGSQRYKATIPENITVNTKIPNLQITATDIDENPSLKYSLIPAGQNSKGIEDYMKIEDKYNGFITVVKALDYETRNFFEYTVEVFVNVNMGNQQLMQNDTSCKQSKDEELAQINGPETLPKKTEKQYVSTATSSLEDWLDSVLDD
ncbi:protocadherin Fat 4 [Octopus vulgaris]|nr:protocadherin Fat 4 [Octopus vulgaris]